MKKKIIKFVFFALIISLKINAQDEKKNNFNLILVIDDKVKLWNNSFKIIYTENEKVNEISNLVYEPGNFHINTEDFNKLLSDNTSYISLNFTYYPQKIDELDEYIYQVEINQRILRSRNIVLYVYNLDTRKKRKKYKFTQLSSEQKYTYEIDCGDLYIGRISK